MSSSLAAASTTNKISSAKPSTSSTKISRSRSSTTTTDSVAQVDSLIGDGQGNVYWQRWAKGDLPDIPTELGSVLLEKFTGGSVVTVAGNSGTSWATDIVTDGTDF